jgi:hypothetical protein
MISEANPVKPGSHRYGFADYEGLKAESRAEPVGLGRLESVPVPLPDGDWPAAEAACDGACSEAAACRGNAQVVTESPTPCRTWSAPARSAAAATPSHAGR